RERVHEGRRRGRGAVLVLRVGGGRVAVEDREVARVNTSRRLRRDQGSRLVWRIVPLGHWGANGRRVTTGYLVELHGVGIDEHGKHVGPIVDVARFDTAA